MLKKKIVYGLSVGIVLINMFCALLLEAADNIEISSDIAVYSKYIWRGFKLDDDPVLQSGVYVSGYGFDLSFWGSTDLENDDSLNSDEMDYSSSYTYNLEDIPLSISGGYIYYDFPPGDTNSQEFFIGLAFSSILSPALTWYHDFEDESQGGGKGDYIVAELSHSIKIENSPVTVDLSGHVGYNNELFIAGSGGDIGCELGFTFSLSDNCSLSPNIAYSIPFGDLSDSNDGNQDNEFYGGVVLSINL